MDEVEGVLDEVLGRKRPRPPREATMALEALPSGIPALRGRGLMGPDERMGSMAASLEMPTDPTARLSARGVLGQSLDVGTAGTGPSSVPGAGAPTASAPRDMPGMRAVTPAELDEAVMRSNARRMGLRTSARADINPATFDRDAGSARGYTAAELSGERRTGLEGIIANLARSGAERRAAMGELARMEGRDRRAQEADNAATTRAMLLRADDTKRYEADADVRAREVAARGQLAASQVNQTGGLARQQVTVDGAMAMQGLRNAGAERRAQIRQEQDQRELQAKERMAEARNTALTSVAEIQGASQQELALLKDALGGMKDGDRLTFDDGTVGILIGGQLVNASDPSQVILARGTSGAPTNTGTAREQLNKNPPNGTASTGASSTGTASTGTKAQPPAATPTAATPAARPAAQGIRMRNPSGKLFVIAEPAVGRAVTLGWVLAN
jgi:hypothetical protein